MTQARRLRTSTAQTGRPAPQQERSSASEPINLGTDRNLTLCVRPTRHLPDNIRYGRLVGRLYSPVQGCRSG
jgi:hypothetical protein